LRQIDSRIRFLLKRLEHLTVVNQVPADPHKIYFGAWVTLEDEDGHEACYRLVGEDELDLEYGYISIDAPLARGLLGKSIDDDVTVSLPRGEQEFYIADVVYERPGWDTRPAVRPHRWEDPS
tara:strand:+ start:1248 stop:1613 length:366 start_codon:yes stop_codon:yes gene_type:complete